MLNESGAYLKQHKHVVTVVSWCPEKVKSPQLYDPDSPAVELVPLNVKNIS